MPRLALDKDFLTEFATLEKPVRERVSEVFAKFDQATHTGLHLEKISGARDDRFRTIRIDQFWRGVVLAPAKGDTYTLLKVLPHDDAYDWAKRRKASVSNMEVTTFQPIRPPLMWSREANRRAAWKGV